MSSTEETIRRVGAVVLSMLLVVAGTAGVAGAAVGGSAGARDVQAADPRDFDGPDADWPRVDDPAVDRSGGPQRRARDADGTSGTGPTDGSTRVAAAGTTGTCDSSRQVKRKGEIHSVSIVEPVDRDGDGKVSSFYVEVTADSRQSRPRRQGKQAFQKAFKLLKSIASKLSGFPIPIGADKDYCVDLVPGFRITVVTDNGREQLGSMYMGTPSDYPGAGERSATGRYYLGPLTSDNAIPRGRYVDGTTIFIEGSASRHRMSNVVPGRPSGTVKKVVVEPCWNPEARGDVDGELPDRCVVAGKRNDLQKLVLATTGEERYARALDEPLAVERATMDRSVEVEVTSDPSGATVVNPQTGEVLGRTPLTTTVGMDVAGAHRARMGKRSSRKRGPFEGGATVQWPLVVRKQYYEARNVSVPLTRDDPSVHASLTSPKKPLTVTSEPNGMAVYVEADHLPAGNYEGTTPWTRMVPANNRYDVTVGHGPDAEYYFVYNQTFAGVRSPATLHANLTTRCLVDCTEFDPLGNYSVTAYDTTRDAIEASRYSNDTGYLTDTQELGDPPVVATGTTFDPDTALDPVLANVSTLSTIDARYTRAPTAPRVGATVRFDARESYSLLGTVTGYRWDFGDGSTASGRIVDHTFRSSGTYTVELTVTDTDGETNTTARTIEVVNGRPVAAFGTSAGGRATVGEGVTFDATGTTDPEGAVQRYEWDFGDGTTATGRTVSHVFASEGNHTVTLTVTDAGGATDAVNRTVAVVKPNQQPTPKVATSPGSSELSVAFSASGSADPDGTIQQYVWSFGDGSYGQGETTSHTFDAPGTYTVELLVTDDDGGLATINRTVSVAEETATGTATAADGGAGTEDGGDADGGSADDGTATPDDSSAGDGQDGDAGDGGGSDGDADDGGGGDGDADEDDSDAGSNGDDTSDDGSGDGPIDVRVPGFGLLAALVALLVTHAVVRRRRRP